MKQQNQKRAKHSEYNADGKTKTIKLKLDLNNSRKIYGYLL